MKYALYLPNFGALGRARTVAEWAQIAEQAGWDGLFIWDHIARDTSMGEVADPWVALSAAAMVTSRISLSALVTPLARRRPWKVARETATLDHLCNGRLIFGAGAGSAGGNQVEWANFGEVTDLKQRGAMLDEALEVLVGLWGGQPFSYQGQYYQVGESQFLPASLQQPRIPVWIAARWPNKVPTRRAAQWDGIFPLFEPETEGQQKADQLRDLMQYLGELRSDLTGFEVACCGNMVGQSRQQVADWLGAYQAAGATWWLEEIVPTYFEGDWKQPWPTEAMLDYIQQGPPRS